MNLPTPPSSPFAAVSLQRLWRPIVAMILVIVVSNIAVQYPLNDWLTWGAFTYPFVFLVSDLTNRAVGAASARKVAWAGFAVAVVLSWWIADPRIAVASGTAFIVSQLLDITVFNRWRAQSWWKAPFFGSMIGSVIDTALFFSIAFVGTQVPWMSLAVGDLAAKWGMALLLLAPYRAMLDHLGWWAPQAEATS